MKKRYFVKAIALCLALILLAACSSATPTAQTDTSSTSPGASTVPASPGDSSAPSSGGSTAAQIVSSRDTMVYGLTADPGTLDPSYPIGVQNMRINAQLYESLFTLDENYEIVNQLITGYEWAKPDKTELILNLKQDVYFHNGEQMKASDVLFSYKRYQQDVPGSLYQIDLIDWNQTKASDDFTVDFVFTKPNLEFIDYSSSFVVAIMSEKGYNDAGGDLNKGSIGTGPYKVDEWVSGDHITLVANEKYWDPGKPYIKTIICRVIVDSSMRLIELETGGVDFTLEILASDIEKVRNNDKLIAVVEQNTAQQQLWFGVESDASKNWKVREALIYAIGNDVYKDVYGDVAMHAPTGFFNASIPGAKAYDFPARDIEKAKALLTEAGYPNGVTMNIGSNQSQDRINYCQIIQQRAADAGITLNIQTFESTAALNALAAGSCDVMVNRMQAPIPVISSLLKFFSKDFATNPWQALGDDYNELFYKMMEAADPAEHQALADELQDMQWYGAHAYYPLDSGDEIYCAVKELQGVKASGTTSIFTLAPVLKNMYFTN